MAPFITALSCLALFFHTLLIWGQTPVVPAPTQTDQILLDNNSNSKADPGHMVRYNVTIQNAGGGNNGSGGTIQNTTGKVPSTAQKS